MTKKLWGSRFKKKSDAIADVFSYSISYDQRLAKYDCLAGIAHATMLGKCKIIPQADASKIVAGLKKIEKTIDAGTFKADPKMEDIHSQIQAMLKKLIGAPAEKLHSARSRNDLVVADMKLYCLVELTLIINAVARVQKAIVKFAADNQDVIIPAYTHLQAAQVVLLSHHLLAYVEMLERDKGRLLDALKRLDVNPLGSCALSGTTLPIDRDLVSCELGFAQTAQNSIDAVSDRDFLIEVASSLAILGTHYSRMCEDLMLWVTAEFDFICIDDSLCTGSSIMPHKKNPDMLELIRGESATLTSNLNRLLVLTKGLPLTYNRDLQLDKPPIFESVEKINLMSALMAKTFNGITLNKKKIAERVNDEYFFTVDVMEYLIQKGISYREAHDMVGKLTKDCLDKGVNISDLSLSKLKTYSPKFEADVKKLLNPVASVKMKKSLGSTNPKMVSKQIAKWKKKLS